MNDELGQVERLVDAAPDLLRPGGRLVVISFHSLEDGIVKHRFREQAKEPNVPPDLAEAMGLAAADDAPPHSEAHRAERSRGGGEPTRAIGQAARRGATMKTPNAIRRLSARVPLAIWPLALLCAVATVWGLTHVWVRLQLISVGYDISRQHQLSHDLTELTQRLSLELRTRMDLGTVERIARERLQMIPPNRARFIPSRSPEQDR